MAATDNFYYTKGDKNKQKYVISALEDYGGINKYNETGDDPNKLYYIDINDSIIYNCYNYSELGKLLLKSGTEIKTQEIYLPNTWEEYLTLTTLGEEYFESMFSTIRSTMDSATSKYDDIRDLSESYIAYIKLTYLRDYYRMKWLPRMSKSSDYMWVLYYNNGEVLIRKKYQYGNYHFSFQDQDIITLFYNNFNKLIDEAKYLMGYEDDLTMIDLKSTDDISLLAINSDTEEEITKIEYGKKFYIKAFAKTTTVDLSKYKIILNGDTELDLYVNDSGEYRTDDIVNKYDYLITVNVEEKKEE